MPHGVDAVVSSLEPSYVEDEYMPSNVEDVRFNNDFVFVGGDPPCLGSSSSGFVFSGDGDGGIED